VKNETLQKEMDVISSAVRNLAILNGGGRLTDKCVALISKKRKKKKKKKRRRGLAYKWKTHISSIMENRLGKQLLWKLKTASP
jgi:uncharacterized protein YbcI